jgi:hypothetical protein
MLNVIHKVIGAGAFFALFAAPLAAVENPCPSLPCASCNNWCDNVSLYGSWLYWKVSGDEFDYAVDKDQIVTGEFDHVSDKERIHNLKFDNDSGFRIGIAWDAPGFCWGFDLNWTHFDTSSSKEKEIDGTGGFPNGTTFVSFPPVDNDYANLFANADALFRAHSNFRYNTVDLEIGKWCCCDGCVMFRPHAGFRFADIHETFKDRVTYSEALFTENPGNAIDQHFKTKNRFKGLGLRAGIDLDFHLCGCWSLIGRSALSAIWGRTHLRNHFGYTTSTISDFYESEIKEHYRQTRFIADLMLGIRNTFICCGCFPVTIEAAWEFHYLFRQHRFWVDDSYFNNDGVEGGPVVQSTTATSSWKKKGDVALSGFTLTAGVDY